MLLNFKNVKQSGFSIKFRLNYSAVEVETALVYFRH